MGDVQTAFGNESAARVMQQVRRRLSPVNGDDLSSSLDRFRADNAAERAESASQKNYSTFHGHRSCSKVTTMQKPPRFAKSDDAKARTILSPGRNYSTRTCASPAVIRPMTVDWANPCRVKAARTAGTSSESHATSNPPDVCGSVSTACHQLSSCGASRTFGPQDCQFRADAPVAIPDRASACSPGSIGTSPAVIRAP